MGKKDKLSVHPVMQYKKEQKKKQIAKSKAQRIPSSKKKASVDLVSHDLKRPLEYGSMQAKGAYSNDVHDYKEPLRSGKMPQPGIPRHYTPHIPRPPPGPPPPSAFTAPPRPTARAKPPLPLEPPPFVIRQPPLPPGPPSQQALYRRDHGSKAVGPALPAAQPDTEVIEKKKLRHLAPDTTRQLAPDHSFLPSTLRVQRQVPGRDKKTTSNVKKPASSLVPTVLRDETALRKADTVSTGPQATAL